LTLVKEIEANPLSSIWKIDFNPNGSEILTGSLIMSSYDVSTGALINEYNKEESKFIYSLCYVRLWILINDV
jgi:hypothetical protein